MVALTSEIQITIFTKAVIILDIISARYHSFVFFLHQQHIVHDTHWECRLSFQKLCCYTWSFVMDVGESSKQYVNGAHAEVITMSLQSRIMNSEMCFEPSFTVQMSSENGTILNVAFSAVLFFNTSLRSNKHTQSFYSNDLKPSGVSLPLLLM